MGTAMKALLGIVVAAMLGGFLTYTNPRIEAYEQFVAQEIQTEMGKHANPLAGLVGSLFGGFAADLLRRQTLRRDYVLFSTYDTALAGQHLRALGVLNNFFVLEHPDFKRQHRP